jgi:ribosomal protein S18 acetylase RimI-like enzyme
MLHKLILAVLSIFCIPICGTKHQPVDLSIFDAKTITQKQILDLKSIYLDAFHSVYIKDWDEKLAQRVHDIFQYYISQYYIDTELILIVANKDDQLAGWALFRKKDNENAIVEILCVDPQFWRQGIGKKLVFAICELYPTISHISLETRTINPITPQFYEAIGFKKADFNSPEYIGYEWYNTRF